MKAIDKYLQIARFNMVKEFLPEKTRLLDIGCNNLELFNHFKYKGITGTGIDPDLDVEPHQIPNNVNGIKSTFPTPELKNEIFDLITALAVFEHIPECDHSGFAMACFNHLKPGGKIILTIPNPLVDPIIHLMQLTGLIDKSLNAYQHYGYKPSHTVPVFVNAGFRVILYQRFQFGLNNLFIFEKR